MVATNDIRNQMEGSGAHTLLFSGLEGMIALGIVDGTAATSIEFFAFGIVCSPVLVLRWSSCTRTRLVSHAAQITGLLSKTVDRSRIFSLLRSPPYIHATLVCSLLQRPRILLLEHSSATMNSFTLEVHSFLFRL